MGVFNRIGLAKGDARAARRGHRIDVDLRVEIRCARDRELQSVLLKDLSMSGARIATPSHFARNELVSLILRSGRGEKLEFACRVSSVRPRRGELHVDYGLKFIGLRPHDAVAISDYLREQERRRVAGSPAFTSGRFR